MKYNSISKSFMVITQDCAKVSFVVSDKLSPTAYDDHKICADKLANILSACVIRREIPAKIIDNY